MIQMFVSPSCQVIYICVRHRIWDWVSSVTERCYFGMLNFIYVFGDTLSMDFCPWFKVLGIKLYPCLDVFEVGVWRMFSIFEYYSSFMFWVSIGCWSHDKRMFLVNKIHSRKWTLRKIFLLHLLHYFGNHDLISILSVYPFFIIWRKLLNLLCVKCNPFYLSACASGPWEWY